MSFLNGITRPLHNGSSWDNFNYDLVVRPQAFGESDIRYAIIVPKEPQKYSANIEETSKKSPEAIKSD